MAAACGGGSRHEHDAGSPPPRDAIADASVQDASAPSIDSKGTDAPDQDASVPLDASATRDSAADAGPSVGCTVAVSHLTMGSMTVTMESSCELATTVDGLIVAMRDDAVVASSHLLDLPCPSSSTVTFTAVGLDATKAEIRHPTDGFTQCDRKDAQ
jgi:hypothetical protein